jgi:hypothetical protein
MNIKHTALALSATVLFISGCAVASDSSDSMQNKSMAKPMMMPFGNKSDVAYAHTLWNKLQSMGFNSTASKLYMGGPPHGKVREVLEGKIDGNLVVVKRNYRGKDMTIDKVAADRSKYLASITVMAKRPGYDPADADWFWVKYAPNGKILSNPKGMKLAGKVAKGMPKGCIACHSAASGGDFLFIQDKNISPKATLIGSM